MKIDTANSHWGAGDLFSRHRLQHPIDRANLQTHMLIQAGAQSILQLGAKTDIAEGLQLNAPLGHERQNKGEVFFYLK